MTTKGTKLLVGPVLVILLALLVAIVGCLGTVVSNSITRNGERLPTRSLTITLDESQRDVLLDQFQKFAEKHGFEIFIRDYELSHEIFNINMQRNDIEIIGRNPFDPRVFEIDFYNQYTAFPASQETVDELVADLKSLLREIPDVTVVEE